MLKQPEAAEEIDAVIHRCTKGVNGKDYQYLKVQADALRLGKLWGAYHFGRQDEDPTKQADWFVARVQNAQLAPGRPVVLALNIEYYAGEKKAMRLSDAAIFMKRVKELTGGTICGLYVGSTYLRKLSQQNITPDQVDVLKEAWLWIPRYYAVTKADGVGNFIPTVPESLTWWSHWTFWQHSEADKPPRRTFFNNLLGKKRVDRDVFNGSPEQLANFWRKHSWSPPSSNTSVASVE
jgi:GH25 family lysozyme M1 (1,4-beta-N-acetylmuramidase)